MKRYPILLFLLSALLLTSCASHRSCSAYFKKNAPQTIPIVQPYVDIYEASRRETVYSDSLSLLASDLLATVLEENITQFPISEFIQIDDEEFDRLIGREGAELASLAREYTYRNDYDITETPLPESLRKLMEDNDFPYLMLLYESGFKRLNYNVAGEIALSAGMAVLTTVLSGGMFTAYFNPSSPYSAAFTLLVADRDRNTVAYYNFVDGESDPLNRAHVYKLLHRLFKKFPGR